MSTTRLQQIQIQVDAKVQLGNESTTIARNLHAIPRDVKKLNGNIGELAHDAKIARSTRQAIKKLDELTIPPTIDAHKRQRRESRLQKYPKNYVNLAYKFAEFLDVPEDQMMLRLFDGSSYGTGRQVDEADFDPTSELVCEIRVSCDEICRNLRMDEYWTKLLETCGRYDPRKDSIVPSAQSLVIMGEGLKGSSIWVDDMVPIPSVSLVRRPQCNPMEGILLIAREPEPEDFDPRQTEGMPYLSPVGWDENGHILPVTGTESALRPWDYSTFTRNKASFAFWMDIRLAVGPQLKATKMIGPSACGPLIELRSVFEAEIGNHRIEFDNPFGGVIRWIRHNDRWYKAGIDVAIEPNLPGFHDPFFDMPHEWYFAWGELSAASLEHVLGPDFLSGAPPANVFMNGQDYISVDPLMQAVQERFRCGAVVELSNRTQALRLLLSDFRKARLANFRAASARQRADLKMHFRSAGPVTFDN